MMEGIYSDDRGVIYYFDSQAGDVRSASIMFGELALSDFTIDVGDSIPLRVRIEPSDSLPEVDIKWVSEDVHIIEVIAVNPNADEVTV